MRSTEVLAGRILGCSTMRHTSLRPSAGMVPMWLPLMLHGAAAFRDALAEKIELARRFHEGLLARIDGGAPLERVAPPHLSTVAFRLVRRDGEPLADWNARNAALLADLPGDWRRCTGQGRWRVWTT